MVEGRDQRVRLAALAAVAAAAGVGVVLWSRHRRRARAMGISDRSPPGYSVSGYSGEVDRADSTQPANSRWSGSSEDPDSRPQMTPGVNLASTDGEQLPAGDPNSTETVRQDSPSGHTWVAFESTGQLVAAAAAAADADAPRFDAGGAADRELPPHSGEDTARDGTVSQPQQRVLPPEDTAARAQARSNLASLYSNVGASLPPKAPHKPLTRRISSQLPAPLQPAVAGSFANAGAAAAGTGPTTVLSEVTQSAMSAASPGGPAEGSDASQESALRLPPGEEGQALPLWQRLLALTAAGVEADDERDAERDNNDTDAGPHEVSISSEWKAGALEERVDTEPASAQQSAEPAPLPPAAQQVREAVFSSYGPMCLKHVRLLLSHTLRSS